MIEFVDLLRQYEAIKEEINHAIQQVINDSAFVGGPYVSKFEEEFKDYIGTKHCVGCANGTDAIELGLQAMGVGPGDEVLVPAISWISTAEAVTMIGATPVFVDVHPDFYTIDIDQIAAKITERTKAIIPVHLYGQAVDMVSLMALAKSHNLKVLEDCAQAHGAQYNGQTVGTFGDCGTFSFYPGKNLGAYGDAGAIVTNNADIAERVAMIGNHGQQGKHNHLIEGRNSRLDSIQAAILSVKLPYLNEWTEARIRHARKFSELLDASKVIAPNEIDNGKHVYHLYVIRSNDRTGMQEYLLNREVQTAIHYPQALPLLPCYQRFGYRMEDFPHAARITSEILSLPMHAGLREDEIEKVCALINQF